ncbi:MAG: hypothetical protein ACYSWX_07995 [Planctomycetota bacterium]|jgi:hypothetical protein
MARFREDYDLVLEAAHAFSLDLACSILAGAGIPTLIAGLDQDRAELGEAHRHITRQDLYVPRGSGARARELLIEAWGSLDPAGSDDAAER